MLSTLGYDTDSYHWKKEHEYEREDQPIFGDPQPKEFDSAPSEPGALDTSHALAAEKPVFSNGSLLTSVVKNARSSNLDSSDDKSSQASLSRSELVEKIGKLFVSPEAAPKLSDGWIRCHGRVVGADIDGFNIQCE